MTTHTLESLIDAAFERRADISPSNVPADLKEALSEIIEGLNAGRLRVAEKIDGAWVTHQWLKKAVLLYFRAHDNGVIDSGATTYFDKVPMRFTGYSDADFRQGGFRVVPPGCQAKPRRLPCGIERDDRFCSLPGPHRGAATRTGCQQARRAFPTSR